jgi:ABC-type phosphate/phosphonate transport system substrate-binding protein
VSARAKWAGRAAAGLALAVSAGLHAGQLPAPEAPAGARRTRLHVIASESMFATVNRNDATAALKSAFEMLGRQRGFVLDSRVVSVAAPAGIRRRLAEDSADLLILAIRDFLELEASGLLKAEIAGTRRRDGDPRYRYVLLVRPEAGVKDFGGLRGKTASVFSHLESGIGMAWLDVSLARGNLGRAASFFGAVNAVRKAQECILPLFFGRIEACIVDEPNFLVMKEMNPQLDRLRVLARSEPLLDSVIAAPVKPHPHRREIMEAILSLHAEPRGVQLLMVFKAAQAVALGPDGLESTRAFWKEHGKLILASGKESVP